MLQASRELHQNMALVEVPAVTYDAFRQVNKNEASVVSGCVPLLHLICLIPAFLVRTAPNPVAPAPSIFSQIVKTLSSLMKPHEASGLALPATLRHGPITWRRQRRHYSGVPCSFRVPHKFTKQRTISRTSALNDCISDKC